MSLVAPIGGALAHAFRDFHGWSDVWIGLLVAVIVVAVAGLGRSVLRSRGQSERVVGYRLAHSDPAHPARIRRWVPLVVIAVAAVSGGVLAGLYVGGDGAGSGANRLNEQLYVWEPQLGPLPELTDVTEAWRLDGWEHETTYDFGGATAIGDLDADGRADIIVGGVEPAIFFGGPDGFEPATGQFETPRTEVTSLGLGDLDRDGRTELLLGRHGLSDVVVWGGEWAVKRDLSFAELTELPSTSATTGFAVADLNGDGTFDLLRVGYGKRDGEPTEDIVYEQTEPRSFRAVPLPDSDRLSLAVEVADVDGDRLADLWITRDVGWIAGADSVYSRRGDAAGEWVDIAPSLDVDLKLDGMGVTIADLTGDGVLDTYIADVGENEFLVGSGDGYEQGAAHGAGRIRPVGAPEEQVSSSWGGGVADLNLDGHPDLVLTNGATEDFLNKLDDTTILIEDPPAILLGLGDGRFADVWPELGLEWSGSSRGMSLGDLDGDGDTDVVIVNRSEGLRVYRNDTPGRSLTVRLAGTECASAGATVLIEVGGEVHHRVLTAHGFLGVHAYEAAVGVGSASFAQVSLTVPGFEPSSLRVDLSDERTFLEVDCPAIVS